MAKTKIVDKNALSQYTEEMKGYIKSQGLGLTEEDINGLIDIKLVPVNETIEDKVDKVDGMGLSSNDYSDEDKSKVDSIPNDAKFTDTVYDDTELSDRVDDLETAVNNTLTNAKEYTDEKVSNLASTTIVDNKISAHNTSISAHSDIRTFISDLSTKINNFLDVDDATTDQLSEVITLIENNKGTLESLTTNKINVSDIVDNLTTSSTSKVLSAKQGVAIKALIDALESELDSHTHAIADVSGLQSALDGKAATSHGTHVSYSSTTPAMDGTASVGSANTVARSDHKHPTDISRASASDLSTHTGNTTIHITSAERTNWNDANSKKHSHSNKSVLDATTASFTIAEKEKLGAIGSITTTQIDALFA